jgi:hypothetical protein
MLVGPWHSHSVGASMLGAKDEQCNNQHEVEGVEGRQRGSITKGRSGVVINMEVQ